MKKISIVVSCYNEEQVLEQFYTNLKNVMSNSRWEYEIIFINDGSIDSSGTILKGLAELDPDVKVINFSRNFGHESAMIAGIDYAVSDGIICMDADLQHPPKYIPEIIDRFEEGYDVITMMRSENKHGNFIENMVSKLFYKILNYFMNTKFEECVSDFFAVSNRVADVLRQEYRENVRYLRGFVQSVGFKKCTIVYQEEKRLAGKGHYSILKLIGFAITTFCGFSDIPLKLGIYSGIIASVCGMLLIVYSLIMKLCFSVPSGYTTIIIALCFLFSLTLVVIGIIGEYIAVLLAEVKNRPIYIVRDVLNISDPKSQVYHDSDRNCRCKNNDGV